MIAGHVSIAVALVTGDRVLSECPRADAERFATAVAMRQWGGLTVPGTSTTVRVEHVAKVVIG